MSITLSSAELEQLATAIRTLVSPLDHPSVDQWRSAVNRELKELLHADSAGFLLPVPQGLAMYSEEHDPAELELYTELPPPPLPDGTPIYARAAQVGVGTSAQIYGRHYDMFLRSAHYNEYAAPGRAYDALVASFGPGEACLGAAAALQLWHDRPDGRLFGPREITLLRLLFPAFRAGVESQLRWGRQRQDLIDALDGLNQPVLVCDRSGKVLHITPTLEAVLDREPQAEQLRGELLAEVSLLSTLSGHGRPDGAAMSGSGGREVSTTRGQYRISGCLYGGPPAGESAHILVSLESKTQIRRAPEEVQARFGLSRAEVRVALLLAEGKSNAEIAEDLYLSPHTVRRHTERILHKMDLRSRSEVAARLHG